MGSNAEEQFPNVLSHARTLFEICECNGGSKLISFEVQRTCASQSDWGKFSEFCDFSNSSDAAEFVHATPQQPPVISHCVMHQIEAENKGCHLIVTQLLMTGGCQGVVCTSSTTSLHKTVSKSIQCTTFKKVSSIVHL